MKEDLVLAVRKMIIHEIHELIRLGLEAKEEQVRSVSAVEQPERQGRLRTDVTIDAIKKLRLMHLPCDEIAEKLGTNSALIYSRLKAAKINGLKQLDNLIAEEESKKERKGVTL